MHPYPQTPFVNYPHQPPPPRRGFSPLATVSILVGAACLVGLFILVRFVGSTAENKAKAEADACTSDTASTDYLWSDWANLLDTNEAATVADWKNHCHKIGGVVRGIDSDFRDQPVVEIGTGGERFEVHTLRCHPDDGDFHKAMLLSAGQPITVWGTGGDEIIGSLNLDHCRWY